MYVKSIELDNFRNYNELSLKFSHGTNILYGDNAQGKTNILEAVYLTGTTKSHRGSKDRDIIKLDQDESHIRMVVERDQVDHRIDMHLRKSKTKGVAINGVPIRKSSELFGLINLVFFSPEDLSIIKNGPSERRRFLDFELCQLDKIYLSELIKYNKIVNQRNNLLKQICFKPDLMETLSIWDMQLCSFGKKIIERRCQFVEQLNEIVYGIHKKLSGGKEQLVIRYEPNVGIDDFEAKLEKSRDRDIQYKMSTTGPHRDDMCFQIGDIDIRKFGSQGQQRTSALSLKLAEIELVRRTIKENPILLLDDVLSELDRNRQNYLMNSIDGIQTIITCTGLEEFINNRFHIDKLYKVINGKVVPEN
jgi:DNA replication and repair protein RecF